MWNRGNTTPVKASITSKTDIKDSKASNKHNKSKQTKKNAIVRSQKIIYIQSQIKNTLAAEWQEIDMPSK